MAMFVSRTQRTMPVICSVSLIQHEVEADYGAYGQQVAWQDTPPSDRSAVYP